MLSVQGKQFINSLAMASEAVPPADQILSLVTRLNILIRHDRAMSKERGQLVRKIRDRLLDAYRDGRIESACAGLAFNSAKNLLESL